MPVETRLVVDQPLDNHVDCLGLQFLLCLPLQLSLVEASFRHAAKNATPEMDRCCINNRFPRQTRQLSTSSAVAVLCCTASVGIERHKQPVSSKPATKTYHRRGPYGGPGTTAGIVSLKKHIWYISRRQPVGVELLYLWLKLGSDGEEGPLVRLHPAVATSHTEKVTTRVQRRQS